MSLRNSKYITVTIIIICKNPSNYFVYNFFSDEALIFTSSSCWVIKYLPAVGIHRRLPVFIIICGLRPTSKCKPPYY